MVGLTTRLRARFSRRASMASTASESDLSLKQPQPPPSAHGPTSKQLRAEEDVVVEEGVVIWRPSESLGSGCDAHASLAAPVSPTGPKAPAGRQQATSIVSLEGSAPLPPTTTPTTKDHLEILPLHERNDSLSTEFPTPNTDTEPESGTLEAQDAKNKKIKEIAETNEEPQRTKTEQDTRRQDNPQGQDFTTIVEESSATTGDELKAIILSGESISRSASKRSQHHPDPKPHRIEVSRRQSLIPQQQTRLIKTLLDTEGLHVEVPTPDTQAKPTPYGLTSPTNYIHHLSNMLTRKIWVKRPGASATMVSIHEEDLVDDVRDMIIRKYANSLGRSFDAPDVTLRIIPREQKQERTLGPEEPMARTLDTYFPGGQTVEEALVIDVPLRRTPRPSPRPGAHYYDESRPAEAASDYFPPMPPVGVIGSSPHPSAISNGHATPHAMSVLTTGHVPLLPSPGGSARRHRDRPRAGRQHTSSPTLIQSHAPQPTGTGMAPAPRVNHSRTHSSNSEHSLTAAHLAANTAGNAQAPIAPLPIAMPTPPVAAAAEIQRTATPPPRVSSPRPNRKKGKKSSQIVEHGAPSGMLNGAVPPINVLIVEDNIINLKLLEAVMKRLKVRWQTAMNGRDAVNKWREGGFHLVLMDIKLPIMSGLEATKEIRRLERLNSIGAFSSLTPVPGENGSVVNDGENTEVAGRATPEHPAAPDILSSKALFKSPVIIVALTASSLQSDRHEALAAGCNDFLTKPVNFVWLERKIMEWGCMQALIDFDGWRKWKDFSQRSGSAENNDSKMLGAAKKKKARSSLGSITGSVAGMTPSKNTIPAAPAPEATAA